MTKDMTSGRITPLLINFTIPLVLGNLFQQFIQGRLFRLLLIGDNLVAQFV